MKYIYFSRRVIAVLIFVLTFLLGFWVGKAYGWDDCRKGRSRSTYLKRSYGNWVRSPAYHQAFHNWAHRKAMRTYYQKERRKKGYKHTTRSTYLKRSCRKGRSRRRLSCRNRCCWRTNYSRMVGYPRRCRP